jgi:hypothetical protein
MLYSYLLVHDSYRAKIRNRNIRTIVLAANQDRKARQNLAVLSASNLEQILFNTTPTQQYAYIVYITPLEHNVSYIMSFCCLYSIMNYKCEYQLLKDQLHQLDN